MPKPRRRYVRVVARWGFLHRMYYATGIHMYDISLGAVVRRTENIPLYSVERLRDILFGYWTYTNFDYTAYLEASWFRDNYENFVDDARLEVVVDWRGIP
ncbi:MAG: hypothetical protein QXP58_07035 [Thermoprotei archaeon]